GQNSPLLKIETLALIDPFLRLLPPLPLRRRQHCAPLAVAPTVGTAALGWHLAGRRPPCPQATPLWTLPLYELVVGSASVAWQWASVAPCGLATGGYCPCGLVMGECRPLQAGRGRLPLRPSRVWPPLQGPWP
ncbi:hypothetical protein BHE74_00050842, partial [Ensete ventricosum]